MEGFIHHLIEISNHHFSVLVVCFCIPYLQIKKREIFSVFPIAFPPTLDSRVGARGGLVTRTCIKDVIVITESSEAKFGRVPNRQSFCFLFFSDDKDVLFALSGYLPSTRTSWTFERSGNSILGEQKREESKFHQSLPLPYSSPEQINLYIDSNNKTRSLQI